MGEDKTEIAIQTELWAESFPSPNTASLGVGDKVRGLLGQQVS